MKALRGSPLSRRLRPRFPLQSRLSLWSILILFPERLRQALRPNRARVMQAKAQVRLALAWEQDRVMQDAGKAGLLSLGQSTSQARSTTRATTQRQMAGARLVEARR